MPHPKFIASSLLFLVAAASSSAAGQSIPSPYAFVDNSQAWALFVGKSDLNPGQLGLGARDASLVGGRYAVAFAGAMNLDIDGTLFLSSRDVLDVTEPVDDRSLGRTDLDILLFNVNLGLNLTGQRTWHGLQPFVIFGGGLAFAQSIDRFLEVNSEMPRDEWFDFGTRFTATFGAGVKYHVSSKISLRLDGMMNHWKIATPVGWRTLANDPLGENIEGEWVAGKSVRLGAAWRL